jgi:hypothetical protein
MPVHRFAGKNQRQMGTRHYTGGHETVPLGEACSGSQVKFTEWIHDGQLRQPVFLGLRTDREGKDVVRE